ncbi:hypothetical protein ARZXY2_4729 (plasmid) [Arthrobacter sp. ZXY-2]|nr:hypothetical protein ARZXY2_4729 [Arthrobacter sp. ZXY-2]
MNLGIYGNFAQLVLKLAAKDQTPPDPWEVVRWANRKVLFDKIVERANSVGVDASAFESVTDRAAFDDHTEAWGNVIDPEHSYVLPADGSGGWLTLLWSYVDTVNSYAAEVEIR